MPTLDDLRSALASREHHAGDPDTVLHHLSEPPRRRAVAPALAAAAVVALAVGGVALARNDDSHPAAGGGGDAAAAPRVWQFSVDPVDGLQITRTSSDYPPDFSHTDSPQQYADIRSTDGSRAGGGLTYEPASMPYYDKYEAGAEQVDLDGTTGYFTPGTHVTQDDLDSSLYAQPWSAAEDNNEHQPRLVWVQPDGSWGLLEGTFGFQPDSYDYDNSAALSTMSQVAEATHFGDSDELKVPFHVTTPMDGTPAGIALYLSDDQTVGACESFDAAIVCRVVNGHETEVPLHVAGPMPVTHATLAYLDRGDGTSVRCTPTDGSDLTAQDCETIARDTDVSPSFDDQSTWIAVG